MLRTIKSQCSAMYLRFQDVCVILCLCHVDDDDDDDEYDDDDDVDDDDDDDDDLEDNG